LSQLAALCADPQLEKGRSSRPVGYGVIGAVCGPIRRLARCDRGAEERRKFMLCNFNPGYNSLHGEHILVPELIKAGSSAWIHQTVPNLRNFAWQQGYGAFSVGISQVQETVHYIEQQLEHHRPRTFQEEYLTFLKKKHGAHCDEKYVWD
jgi:hypothetical protein